MEGSILGDKIMELCPPIKEDIRVPIIPGEFQGSDIDGVSIPALAKLVSSPGPSCRSITSTS